MKSLKERMLDKLQDKPSTLEKIIPTIVTLGVGMIVLEMMTMSLKEQGIIA